MIDVLRHPTFRLLWLSHASALLGTGIASVALSLLAFRLAGANASTVLGTILALKMIMYVLVAPLIGALHIPHRRALLLSLDALRIAAACALPWVTTTEHIYLLLALLYAATAAYTPTLQALIPDVLPEERDYTHALALTRLSSDLETVASPTLTALLLLAMQPTDLFYVTAAGFAASFLCVGAAGFARSTARPPTDPYLQRLRRGLGILLTIPALRGVVGANVASAGAGSFVLVLTVIVAKVLLQGSDTLVAILLASMGVGSITAALTLSVVMARLGGRATILLGLAVMTAAAVIACPVVAFAAPGHGWAVGIALTWAVSGWGWCCASAPISKLIKDDVPAHDRVAAFAAQFSLSHAAWLVMYPLTGWVGNATLGGAAVMCAAVALAGTGAAWAGWRHADVVAAPQR